MTVELTKEQMENVKIFLNRVELKGNEVPAFVEILSQLNNAKDKDNGSV